MPDVRLRCECSAADAELVAYLLFENGALALTESDGSERSTIDAGFDTETTATLAAQVIAHPSRTIIVELVEPGWVTQQQAAIEPTAAGRWFIVAPWHSTTEPSDAEHDLCRIVIDPGPAFGHGGHPTTAAALELLDRFVDQLGTAHDLGTGTGVLAIAAASQGVDVEAVEVSIDAAAVARRNVEVNQVQDRVRVHDADATEWSVPPVDAAFANVTIDVHRTIARTLDAAELVLLTGVLSHQVDELLSLHPDRTEVERVSRDSWVAVALRRHSAEQR